MTAILGVYVGQAGLVNFEVGVAAGTWGWQGQWSEPAQLKAGDLLILAQGGGGRVGVDEWVKRVSGTLVLGVVTRPLYTSPTALWPDEKTGERRYPSRIDFDVVGRVAHRPYADLPVSVNKLLQTSATKQGRGFLARLGDSEQAAVMAVFDTPRHGADPPASLPQTHSLRENLARVLALQSSYVSTNTEAMNERGVIVRRTIPALLRELELGMEVEGRDGTGRKTRVPWVRLFDRDRSPSATQGFDVVYLFSADGQRVVLSLNQGTTDFVDNQFRPKPRADVLSRVGWARQVLGARVSGRLEPIDLGDAGGLGEGYEVGHIMGWTYGADAIPNDDELKADLVEAVEALQVLYEHENQIAPVTAAPVIDEPATPVGELPEDPIVDFEWLMKTTLWPEDELREIVDTLRHRRHQVALAGPPGTGKTWVAEAIARHLTGGREGAVHLVQFHPTYGYEDFVQGLRPVAAGGQVSFDVVDGPLVSIADQARRVKHPVVVIIDEMNRANLPSVFGELLYLLEYRDKEIRLLHRESFSLPRNLYIIGTMNTADRSIRSVDTALRRRFDLFDCPPRPEFLTRHFSEGHHTDVVDLGMGLERLNQRLTEQLDRHHTVGHSFFWSHEGAFWRTDLERTWKRQIQPLIEEYFFDQPDLAASFALESFWPSI